jgi:hypothetical protein
MSLKWCFCKDVKNELTIDGLTNGLTNGLTKSEKKYTG